MNGVHPIHNGADESDTESDLGSIHQRSSEFATFYPNYSSESLLQKCPKLLSAFDCAAQHAKISAVVEDQIDAGKWLLENQVFLNWKLGRSPPRLLWLKGIPGCGKTVLSAVTINHLRRNGLQPGCRTAVLFFYCNSKDSTKRHRKYILSAFVEQLFMMVSPDSPSLERIFNQYRHAQSKRLPLPYTDFILDLSREFERTFIILDGVDECDDLNKLIPELKKLAKGVHILISSRHYPDIGCMLGRYEEILISQEDVINDIQAFVEIELRRVKIRKQEVRKSINDELVSGAQGTFLGPASYLRHVRMLRGDSDIQRALASLPRGINETIIAALEKIDAQPHSHLLRAALQLVTCAVRPITRRALIHAIATLEMEHTWDPTRIIYATSVVDDCSNLLMCVPAARKAQYEHYWHNDNADDFARDDLADDDFIVVPFHDKVKEFLLANPSTLPVPLAPYSLHPPRSVHEGLAKLCLNHLKLLKTTEDPDLTPSHYPFAMYALFSWLLHIRAAKMDVADFREHLSIWRSTRLTTWVPNPAHMAVRLNLPVNQLSEKFLVAEDDTGLSPLHYAVKYSSTIPVVDCLLEKSDLNQISNDEHEATALHFAAMYYPDVIQLLLKAGADANARAKGKLTPMHVLLEWHGPEYSLPYVLPLLGHGANVNAQNTSLSTPLHIVTRHAHSDSLGRIAENLLDHGANIDECDAEGSTPLHLAAESGYVPTVALLLRKDATVDAIDKSLDTPLVIALRAASAGNLTPHERIVQLLLRHGADINYSRGRNLNRTPLHEAAESGNLPFASALLKYRANVNAVDNHGRTPLHVVCSRRYQDKTERKKYERIGRLLFDHGANINARDGSDSTPFDWAKQYDNIPLFPFVLSDDILRAAVSDDKYKDYATYVKPPTPPPKTVQGYNPSLDEPRPKMIEDYIRHYEPLILVDDSSSMLGYKWSEARDALFGIVKCALKMEALTVSVRFLNSPFRVTELQRVEKLESAFDRVKPSGGTPTGYALQKVFDEYLTKIEKASQNTAEYSKIPPLDIIVLTDGMPTDNPAGVIAQAVKRLREGHLHPNTMNIHFIQIGRDEMAEKALQELLAGDNGSIVSIVLNRSPGNLTPEELEDILLRAVHPNVHAKQRANGLVT